jgi:predicted O-methyltransferase YrrM
MKKFNGTDSSGMRNIKGPILYSVARTLKPSVVIETGVASGVSTLFLLQALSYNNYGRLFSIDKPNVEEGSKIPRDTMHGWIIPTGLRGRWSLILGDTKEKLPLLLKDLDTVDIFLHDSLHSYQHMLWEYRMVWPHIAKGGVLFSDDITANSAFFDFIKEIDQCVFEVHNDFGIIRNL